MTLMNKPALALMAACVLSLCSPLRAEDDEAEESSETATSAAAAAARNKGYKVEGTRPAPATDEDEAPIERHREPRTLFTAPPQRPLGAAERRAAAAGGGASSGTGAGISCEKSDPPLTRVIREEVHGLIRDTNKIRQFAFGPNEAISYKFTAQKSGSGGFSTNEGTQARRESTLMSVSETPCDFDVEKALAGMDRGPASPRGKWSPCHVYNIGPGGGIGIVPIGQALAPGANTSAICFVKPGKTYYFNIRSFSADYVNKRDYRDACAVSAKTMGPGLKCGGIWQFIGSEAGGGEKK